MLFRKPPSAPPAPPVLPADPLDQVLLNLSEVDPFTLRNACEGVQVFGSSGSGKTSGSGRLFATSYLTNGFGGLVLTAKEDEIELWCQYAAETGRRGDLIVFGPNSPFRFNFIDYEWRHAGEGAGHTQNIIELFVTLAEISSRSQARAGSDSDRFWRDELKKIVGNAVDILRLAGERVDLPNIARIIQTAPISEEQANESQIFQKASFCFQTGLKAALLDKEGKLSPSDSADLQSATEYWMVEYPRMYPEQRSGVISTFTGMVYPFLRGTMRELFSTTTNITPENTFDGKIILLDLSLKKHHELGAIAQVMFKYVWQRAVERRKVASNSTPLFLWADESQWFICRHDPLFQTTARSARVCTVYLTQNLPNYRHALGGDENANALVQSLLGNLSTKVFHNNTCPDTNRFASELFSRDWRRKVSVNASHQEPKISTGRSYSDELQSEVEPIEFTRLATGGPEYEFLVEGLVHRAGRIFNATEKNYLRVLFSQKS